MFPKKVSLADGALFGLIDIGSSMMRLVVYRMENGYPHIFINQRIWTALAKNKGSGIFKIDDAGISNLKKGLEQFVEVCSDAKCLEIQCFATSALREAENGSAVVSEFYLKQALKFR